MEFRIEIENFETSKYSIKTIEYIKGVLHTYAHVNQPNTNLSYVYDIVEFEKSENIAETLKGRFYIFKNQEIELNEISNDNFLGILRDWFYGFEISKLIAEYRQGPEVKFFLELLKDILKIDEIFMIENLQHENEETYLELGVYFDYFVLKSTEKNYILYFKYCD